MRKRPPGGPFWKATATAFLVLLCCPSAGRAVQRGYEADLHYERGAHALRKGDPEAAAPDLARAVELVPDDPDALGLYARALLVLGRSDEALEVLEDLQHIEPAAQDLELMLGLAYTRLGRWPEARDHLETAREREPDNSRIRLFLGIALQELGESDAAERELRGAYALDPTLETAGAYRLALLALREDRPEEARRLLEDVLRRVPGSSLASSAATYLLLMDEGEARRWQAFATAGFGHDTNVNLFGDLGGPSAISRDSDVFANFDAGIEGVVWERDRMRLWLGYRGDLIAYRHDDELNIEATDGWANFSWDFADRFSLDLRSDLSWVWVDWESFRRATALEPALRFFARDDLYARLFYRYADRGFFTEPTGIDGTEATGKSLDRDGKVQVIGLDQYWLPPDLRGWGRGYLRVGLRYRSEDDQGKEFDSHGPIAVVTVGLPLPYESFLTLDGWYEQRKFDHPSQFEAGEGDRDDQISRIRLALRRQLTRRVHVTASWLYTHWRSNVGLYDFDRSVTDLRLTYRY